MNILAFTTTYWDDNAALAEAKKPELSDWLFRVGKRFDAKNVFLATGCQDDASLNPLRHLSPSALRHWSCVATDIMVVNSGVPKTKPYDTYRYSYFLCAFEAALWYALRLPNWELLVDMESDCWTNPKVDMMAMLQEFQARPELIMAPAWSDCPDFNLLVMKRAALPRFLHHRLRANIVEEPLPQPMLPEYELAAIFKGLWWCPWPDVRMIRQHWGIPPNPPSWDVTPDEIAKNWPVVALPSPAIKELFK